MFPFFKKRRDSQPNTHNDIPKRTNYIFPRYSISFRDPANPFIPYCRDVSMDGDWKIAPWNGKLYYDPIEDYPVFQHIIKEIDEMVDAELGDRKGTLGSCHAAWSIRKRLLKEYYGITWHSTQDMNPSCHFD